MRYITTTLIMQLFFYSANCQITDTLNAYNIMNKAIDAIGGKEYLSGIITLYTDMKTEMDGREVHWIVKEMKPNKGSFQITYKNRIIYQSWFDGKKGYAIVNGEKKRRDEDFKDKKLKKNIFDELDYLDSSLWKIELLGDAQVDSISCYKIKATLSTGLTKLLYYNKRNYLLIKDEKIIKSEPGRFTTFIFPSYSKYGQLIYFRKLKYGDEEPNLKGEIVELLTNEKVNDKDFK